MSKLQRVLAMKGIVLFVFTIIFSCGIMGCSSQMESDVAEFVELLAVFDFENGKEDWEGGISDYPVDYGGSMDYTFENLQVPSALAVEGNGLSIYADNPHGDIFYYFKRTPNLYLAKNPEMPFLFGLAPVPRGRDSTGGCFSSMPLS